MTKTRIISGVIGFIGLLIIVLLGKMAIGLAITLAALIGIYEFYNAMMHAGYKPIRLIGLLSCSFILFLTFFSGKDIFIGADWIQMAAFGIFLMVVISFACIVFSGNRYTINDVALTVFGILYVVFLFSFVLLTRTLEHGELFIWLIFIGAFATDTFAYTCGRLFGKTKIIPAVSPNKTVEGSIGGIVGCILIMVGYGALMNGMKWVVPAIPLYHFVILGVLCGCISQIGDWAASAIKRSVKVKDFGKIMPGHGGVLDRCDSILFTAPVIYFYLCFMIF